jgi:hypothetical protein
MEKENCLFLGMLRTELSAFKDHESGVSAPLPISHLLFPAVFIMESLKFSHGGLFTRASRVEIHCRFLGDGDYGGISATGSVSG